MADNVLKGLVQFEVAGVPELKKAAGGVDLLANRMKAARGVGQSFNQVLREAPAFAFSFQTGIVGISNNLPILADAIKGAQESGAGFEDIFSSLAESLFSLPSILSIASLLAVQFGDSLFGASKSASDAAENMKKLSESTKAIFESAGREAAEVSTLIALLKSETETRERKLLAIKELQKIQPEVFEGLRIEGNTVSGLDAAYQNYIANLRTVIAVKIRQAQLEQLITKQLQLQGATLTNTEKALFNAVKGFQDQQLAAARNDPSQRGAITKAILGKRGELAGELNQVQADIDFILKQITELSKGVKLDSKPTGAITIKPEKVTLKPLQPVEIEASRVKLNNVAVDTSNLPISPKPATVNTNIDAAKNALLDLQKVGFFVGESLASVFGAAFAAIGNGKSAIKAAGEAVKGLVVQLVKAAIQAAITSIILNAIAPGLGKAAGGFSGIFGNMLGLGGKRAAGGPVTGGAAYLVGEKGPEIFRPGTTGSIIPNGNLGSFGGGGLSGMMGRVVFEISANKLIGVMANGNRSQAILV